MGTGDTSVQRRRRRVAPEGRPADRSTPDPVTTPAPATGEGSRTGLVPVVIIVGLYFLVWASLFDPSGHLLTDVGGKTGTLAAMEERGDWRPDLGYWAADLDPEGLAHPYHNTWVSPNGSYVNSTSLPMVMAARPLHAIGGVSAIRLLPMVAALGAVVVAGCLQRRIDRSDGRAAALVVGVATPLAIYAVDFWEHAPGVLLTGLGFLAVVELDRRDRSASPTAGPAVTTSSAVPARWRTSAGLGLGAGAAFGLAATMRQEALVYGFVAGLVVVLGPIVRRRRPTTSAFVPGSAMAGAALGVLALSTLAEIQLYGGALRAGRTSAVAAGVGGGGDRVETALVTTLGALNAAHPLSYLFGGLLLVGLVWLGLAAERGRPLLVPTVAVSLVGGLLALWFLRFGPLFVPGLFPATPLAVLGVVAGRRVAAARVPLILALAPIPLVWLTQYSGGAVVQWGGRYLLPTGFLLVVVAAATVPSVHVRLFRTMVAVSLAVTLGGLWLGAWRTNEVASDVATVTAVARDEIVVWYDPVRAREAGEAVVGRQWLSTHGGASTDTVFAVLDAVDADRFVYVDPIGATPPDFPGWEPIPEIGRWQTGEVLDQRLTQYVRR